MFTLPSGRSVSIPKTTPKFDLWRETVPFDRYGNKPVLSFDRQPLFAELVILRTLEGDGWTGAWVDTYRRCFRREVSAKVELPQDIAAQLKGIHAKTGSRGGCFDVVAWRDRQILFAESKWADRDQIRSSQLRWLEAALSSGFEPESFLIVEWSLRTKI